MDTGWEFEIMWLHTEYDFIGSDIKWVWLYSNIHSLDSILWNSSRFE